MIVSNIIMAIILIFITINTTSMAYNFSSNVVKFQTKLANKGNSVAQYQLGIMYETGSGVDKDIGSALKWYRKSANQNNKNAERRIVYLEIIKSGFQKEKHTIWLNNLENEASNSGEASFLLGVLYHKGLGVESSLEKSRSFLKIAARKNTSGADDELAKIESLILFKKEQDISIKQAENIRVIMKRKIELQKKNELKRIKENKIKQKIAYKKPQDIIHKKNIEEKNRKKLTLPNIITPNNMQSDIKKQNKTPALSWKQALEKNKSNTKKSSNEMDNSKKKIKQPYVHKNNGPSWSDTIKTKDNVSIKKEKNIGAGDISNRVVIDTVAPSWEDAVKLNKN